MMQDVLYCYFCLLLGTLGSTDSFRHYRQTPAIVGSSSSSEEEHNEDDSEEENEWVLTPEVGVKRPHQPSPLAPRSPAHKLRVLGSPALYRARAVVRKSAGLKQTLIKLVERGRYKALVTKLEKSTPGQKALITFLHTKCNWEADKGKVTHLLGHLTRQSIEEFDIEDCQSEIEEKLPYLWSSLGGALGVDEE